MAIFLFKQIFVDKTEPNPGKRRHRIVLLLDTISGCIGPQGPSEKNRLSADAYSSWPWPVTAYRANCFRTGIKTGDQVFESGFGHPVARGRGIAKAPGAFFPPQSFLRRRMKTAGQDRVVPPERLELPTY